MQNFSNCFEDVDSIRSNLSVLRRKKLESISCILKKKQLNVTHDIVTRDDQHFIWVISHSDVVDHPHKNNRTNIVFFCI